MHLLSVLSGCGEQSGLPWEATPRMLSAAPLGAMVPREGYSGRECRAVGAEVLFDVVG